MSIICPARLLYNVLLHILGHPLLKTYIIHIVLIPKDWHRKKKIVMKLYHKKPNRNSIWINVGSRNWVQAVKENWSIFKGRTRRRFMECRMQRFFISREFYVHKGLSKVFRTTAYLQIVLSCKFIIGSNARLSKKQATVPVQPVRDKLCVLLLRIPRFNATFSSPKMWFD